MKKLLLILLCVPLIGLGQENKNCNRNPDYIMTAKDFIRFIEKNNKKYDGKVFQFTIDRSKKSGSGRGFGQAKISFDFFKVDAELDFNFDVWSDYENEYYEKLSDASKKRGYTGSVLTIKGVYSYENSKLKKDDYIKGEYEFINCCLVVPNKNNNNTNNKNSKKIDNNKEEVEEEIYGVINDPDGYTNVREDKSSKSEIVFKVYKNKRFKIIDNSGNWWLIEYNGEQGYMYKNRIDVIK